jgi:2-phosphosulfolactate phosphatase
VKLFVFHTPELVPNGQAPDCAIAIDVLRATTTIAAALANGAEAVHAFSNIDTLMTVSEKWPANQRIRAGERGGAKVEGCDLGNSPLECTPDQVKGRHLFISTTNGTRCLERIQDASTVITAALINRRSVVDYLISTQPETVWVVGSGWEGSYALEDTVCAGAIAHSLSAHLTAVSGHGIEQLAGNDEVVGSLSLYQQWHHRLLALMHSASHGKRLLRLNCVDDLKYCAQMDSLDVLPIQQEPGTLKPFKPMV